MSKITFKRTDFQAGFYLLSIVDNRKYAHYNKLHMKKNEPEAIQTQAPSKNLLIIVGVVVLVLLAVVPGYYFYNKYQKAQNLLKNPAAATEEEVRNTVEAVGKLIDVPAGEAPQVATVTDINKLRKNAIFSKAQNGDKVLIYSRAKKAIIYRPSTNKIIEVGPININTDTSAKTSSPSASMAPKKLTVAIYNGTTIVGLGGTNEKKLASKYSNVTVAQVANAKKRDYTKTIIVDLKGNNKAFVSDLANFLSGEVGTLPTGEFKPDTDILIIVSK